MLKHAPRFHIKYSILYFAELLRKILPVYKFWRSVQIRVQTRYRIWAFSLLLSPNNYALWDLIKIHCGTSNIRKFEMKPIIFLKLNNLKEV
jgi:hypothetical protein